MPIELPDLNVLLALVDPMHVHHEVASTWFADACLQGWATCPLTQNGFVRIISTPIYPGIRLSIPDATLFLETLIHNHATTHHFWPDDVSLRDTALFDISAVAGPKQITDVYLLGLCQQHGGTLVTLDARIATAAITMPHSALLRLLTP